MTTDRILESFDALDRHAASYQFETLKAKVARLSVAELRVLLVHYCHVSAAEAREVRKSDLIVEVTEALIENEVQL